MKSGVAGISQLGPFSRKEHDTISNTFAFYNLSLDDEKHAWKMIDKVWHETSGRFYAYNTAHRIAAAVKSEGI